jgi:universal stress protein A
MQLFEKILFPVDFSECSVKALLWTEYLARKYGSKVTVLHVFTPEFTPAGPDPFVYDYGPIETIKRAEERLENFVSPLRVDCETLVYPGRAADEIIEVARQIDATMIIMGTHGRKGLVHKILGSTTEEVFRKTNLPVFTISPNATIAEMQKRKRFLVPVSSAKERPGNFMTMKAILEQFGTSLTLMNVIDYHDEMFGVNFHANPFNVTAYETTEKERELLKIGELMNGKQTKVIIKFGEAAEEILNEAWDPKYTCLLLGVKKEKALSRLFESTAYRVISQAPIPVITLKML